LKKSDRVNAAYRTFTLLLVLLALPWSAGAQQQDPSRLPLEERAYIASEIYAAIPLYFAHWEGAPADLDLAASYRAYLAKALSTDDRREFALATAEFMAKLRNGHTFFWDRWVYQEHGQPLGFTARPLQGRWVVTASQVEGLRPGDVIRTLNGEPIDSFVQHQTRYIAASSDYAARALLFHPQRQEHLFPAEITLGLVGSRSVSIERKAVSLTRSQETTQTELLDGGRIAYVRIPFFGAPAFEDSAIAFIERHKHVPAVIVDVRGNGGGNTPAELIAALMDRPYRWFVEATPMAPALLRGRFPDGQLRWREPPVQPKEHAYRGRVILIADALCGSSCEDFLAPFKDNGRAILVGETTAGSTGQPYFRRFERSMHFIVGMKRVSFADGSVFEGVGIRPDVAVEPTIDDIRRGRDRALERAVELARSARAPQGK
jgi:carboxyl-terminal processing protease